MKRVVVTGMGVVTPLGCGVKPTWDGIINSRSGLKAITHFDVSDLPARVAGQVPLGTGLPSESFYTLPTFCN
jgi:3-oxoacyl-[acyl-carrier-protein] synthase II